MGAIRGNVQLTTWYERCHNFTNKSITLQLIQSPYLVKQLSQELLSCCSYQHTSKFTNGTTLHMAWLYWMRLDVMIWDSGLWFWIHPMGCGNPRQHVKDQENTGSVSCLLHLALSSITFSYIFMWFSFVWTKCVFQAIPPTSCEYFSRWPQLEKNICKLIGLMSQWVKRETVTINV